MYLLSNLSIHYLKKGSAIARYACTCKVQNQCSFVMFMSPDKTKVAKRDTLSADFQSVFPVVTLYLNKYFTITSVMQEILKLSLYD